MTDTTTGWRELTRTRLIAGQAHFTFVDGPACGRQLLNVGTAWTPALYAVLVHDKYGEVVYMRRPALDRWHFEFIRPVIHQSEHVTCPACGRTSAHPKDLEYGWCAACNAYTQLGAEEAASIGHLVGDVVPGQHG